MITRSRLSLALPLLGGLALVVMGCFSCGGDGAPTLPRPGFDGTRAYGLLQRIVACGERTPGSQGAAKMRRILKEELTGLGIPWEEQRFPQTIRGVVRPLENLWARLPGTDPERVILIGTHYDTKITSGHPEEQHNFPFQGANDGGSGTVALVELARHLKERPRRCTYWLVWFDGEESVPFYWDDNQSLFGSTHFAANLKAKGLQDRVRAMILLDIIGAPDLRLDDDTLSAPELKRTILTAARQLGLAGHFFQGQPTPIKDDHWPFIGLGIPTVNLIGLTQLTERGIWHTRHDTIDKVSPDSLALVGDVVLTALTALEQP